jgi:hypothetical protein
LQDDCGASDTTPEYIAGSKGAEIRIAPIPTYIPFHGGKPEAFPETQYFCSQLIGHISDKYLPMEVREAGRGNKYSLTL